MARKEEIHHEAYVRHGLTNQNVKAFEEGAEWADTTMLKKAVEWMQHHLQTEYNGLSDYVKDFRKAMTK